MTSWSQSKISPYSPQQIFDLVLDIEKYPEFIPWVSDVRIKDTKTGEIIGELIVRFGIFSEKYTSRIQYSVGTQPEIIVTLIEGPFKYLNNKWLFEPTENGGCIINFGIDFEFNSKLLDKLIGRFFETATHKLVGAFEKRARELYGQK